MIPYMAKNDIDLFYKYLDNSKIYFEFGSGGSTYQASIRNNIQTIYSVESDLEWHNKLKTILKDKNNIKFIYNEMNTIPNSWGNPGPNSTNEQKKNYSNQILLLNENDVKTIDLILVDGRFRVACCLKCFDVINNDCFIIVDDFFNRPEYYILSEFYDIVDNTTDEQMVILRKKKNITTISKELISKYELEEN